MAAHIWIHELLHIDWVSQAEQYGSNAHVTDIKMQMRFADGSKKDITVYGPAAAKSLARWGYDTGSWVIRNSDNLALYAMARYVQKALGDVYPHLPFAPKPPDSVYPPDTFTAADGMFTIDSDGTGTLANSSEVSALLWDPSSTCANDDDEDGDSDPDAILVLSAGFANSSYFPADYLANYTSWINGAT